MRSRSPRPQARTKSSAYATAYVGMGSSCDPAAADEDGMTSALAWAVAAGAASPASARTAPLRTAVVRWVFLVMLSLPAWFGARVRPTPGATARRGAGVAPGISDLAEPLVSSTA